MYKKLKILICLFFLTAKLYSQNIDTVVYASYNTYLKEGKGIHFPFFKSSTTLNQILKKNFFTMGELDSGNSLNFLITQCIQILKFKNLNFRVMTWSKNYISFKINYETYTGSTLSHNTEYYTINIKEKKLINVFNLIPASKIKTTKKMLLQKIALFRKEVIQKIKEEYKKNIISTEEYSQSLKYTKECYKDIPETEFFIEKNCLTLIMPCGFPTPLIGLESKIFITFNNKEMNNFFIKLN